MTTTDSNNSTLKGIAIGAGVGLAAFGLGFVVNNTLHPTTTVLVVESTDIAPETENAVPEPSSEPSDSIAPVLEDPAAAESTTAGDDTSGTAGENGGAAPAAPTTSIVPASEAPDTPPEEDPPAEAPPVPADEPDAPTLNPPADDGPVVPIIEIPLGGNEAGALFPKLPVSEDDPCQEFRDAGGNPGFLPPYLNPCD